MKKRDLSLEPWLDKLDSHWKRLPEEKRKRVVIYSFAGYLILTLVVFFQVITHVGQQNEIIPVKHITNPLTDCMDKGFDQENSKELKKGNNERE